MKPLLPRRVLITALAFLALLACQCSEPGGSAGPMATSATSTAATKPGVDVRAGSRIEIRGDAILLDGYAAGKPADITALDQKVDALFKGLSTLPADRQSKEVTLVVDVSTPWTVLESVLRTAASAGYPVLTVTVDGKGIKLRSPALGLSDPAPAAPGASGQEPIDILVGTVKEGTLGFVVKKGSTVLAENKSAKDAGLHISEICGKVGQPCFARVGLFPEPTTPFIDVARVLSLIAPHQHTTAETELGNAPELVLMLQRKDDAEESPATPEVAEIRQVVRASFTEFRACYEEGLKKDPKLAGTVAVRLTIQKDGSVAGVKEDTAASGKGPALTDKAVVKCIVDKFKKLAFAKRDKVTTIRYPIKLEPGL